MAFDKQNYMISDLKKTRFLYLVLQSSFRCRMLSVLMNFPGGEMRLREFIIFLRVRRAHKENVMGYIDMMVKHGILKSRNGFPGKWYSLNIDAPYKQVLIENIKYLYDHSPTMWADLNFVKTKYQELKSTIKDHAPLLHLKHTILENEEFPDIMYQGDIE